MPGQRAAAQVALFSP